jgi:hypothetical protein
MKSKDKIINELYDIIGAYEMLNENQLIYLKAGFNIQILLRDLKDYNADEQIVKNIEYIKLNYDRMHYEYQQAKYIADGLKVNIPYLIEYAKDLEKQLEALNEL